MKTIIKTFICISLLVIAGEVSAETFTLGTATKGGGFELFGKTFSKALNSTNTVIKIKPVQTKGSRQNLKLLVSGKVDIAQVEGNAAFAAFQQKEIQDKIAILWVMYPSPGAFIVRKDKPFKTINDLKGKTIAWGTQASGLRILAKSIVEGLELDTDKDFKSVILNKASEGPALILENKVDALWGGGIGWPTFKKISAGTKGARFIAPSEDEISAILKARPHLSKMTIPANTYKGQTEPVNSVGLWSLILVRKDIPEEKVFSLAQAIGAAESTLAELLPQTAFTTAKNTARYADRKRLHNGSARYLMDKGMLKK